jgi:hypothetical protein
LKIDFIDESVDDLDDPNGMLDYIGSIRIPLAEFLKKEILESTFPVINEKNQ